MEVKKQINISVLLVILVVTITLMPGITKGAERAAILIGINQYAQEQQILPLQSSASDARKLGQVLSQNGYECQIVVDENAKKDQITEAFIQMEQQTSQTGELDLFLVYFSGRGTRVTDDIQADETQDGMDECILPSDATAGNTRSFIRDDALARRISAVKAKQVLVILDCAFWGDNANPNIKGVGDLTEAQSLDGIEIIDGLPQDVVIISAGLPGTHIEDGVFTSTFLESLVTEEADGDGDRVISFAEAYQFAHRQLQERQPPRVVGSKAADIPFAPLPPLSRLQVQSDPSKAQVILYRGSEKVQSGEVYNTPAMISLTKGTYGIQVQKKGFLIPETREALITEYNSLYAVDAFQLIPIKVVGQANVTNKAGESISIADGVLTIHVNEKDREVHQEALSADGLFQFAPDTHSWLAVGSEYEFRITGKPVLSAEPVRFTYDGYVDINTAVTVTLDDIPPVLSTKGVTLQVAYLVAGEKLQGLVNAKDDDLGLTDSISIKLQPPDEAEITSVPSTNIRFQPPGAYEFSYTIPNVPASAGEWSVAAITLEDKAGNKADLSGEQISAKCQVFPSRFALGKYYFDAEDYARALDHLKQIAPPDDDTHYFSALSYHYLNDQAEALTSFQKIEDKSRYLGQARSSEMPQMPRKMANRLWGELLNKLDTNREDASYMELLAITAEELGRTYEAKVYRDRAKKLRKTPE